jgi:5-methylcytosine-specific restriction endonuclease McrA
MLKAMKIHPNKGRIPGNKGLTGVQIVTEETRAKLRFVRLGNTNNVGKKRSVETRQKLRLAHKTGPEHHSWRGGIKRSRYCFEHKVWREQVFERDNYTCQECHTHGCYLEAHHVKPWATHPALRYEVANGIALCKECHAKTDSYKGRSKPKK